MKMIALFCLLICCPMYSSANEFNSMKWNAYKLVDPEGFCSFGMAAFVNGKILNPEYGLLYFIEAFERTGLNKPNEPDFVQKKKEFDAFMPEFEGVELSNCSADSKVAYAKLKKASNQLNNALKFSRFSTDARNSFYNVSGALVELLNILKSDNKKATYPLKIFNTRFYTPILKQDVEDLAFHLQYRPYAGSVKGVSETYVLPEFKKIGPWRKYQNDLGNIFYKVSHDVGYLICDIGKKIELSNGEYAKKATCWNSDFDDFGKEFESRANWDMGKKLSVSALSDHIVDKK